jgi:hypothetical protein
MTELIKRIDELASSCSSSYISDFTYKRVVCEVEGLIIEIAGENSSYMRSFNSILCNRKIDQTEACSYFAGILRALKNYIHIREKDKKYQFFISSTYLDLINYRKIVADEISFRGHIPAGMEDFTACGEDLKTYIKHVIDDSDYYVLLIGQRFGSPIPTDENTSYTMMEYEYAKSKGKRIIPFIYNGKQFLNGNDLDINKEKFDNFVSKVSKSVPQYFKDENELIKKLTKALDNEIKNHPQKGWIRL